MDSSKSKIGTFILGWGAALILFFPILWMLLTGFKTEAEAIATPPACSSRRRWRTITRCSSGRII